MSNDLQDYEGYLFQGKVFEKNGRLVGAFQDAAYCSISVWGIAELDQRIKELKQLGYKDTALETGRAAILAASNSQ